MTFTRKELAECVQRELTKRHEVYGRSLREGKMKQSVADDQIAKMQAVFRVIMASGDELISAAQR